jgi:YfiR/HmsC-like
VKQFFLTIALTFVLSLAPSFGYTTEIPSESQLKAAYLYNFAKFIYWPESAFANEQDSLIIGVLGNNPFSKELTPLTKRKVRGRPIKIIEFKTVEDIQTCHLLYINPSIAKLETILKTLLNKPIVTVGDNKNFANLSGMIQFVTRRERLRFIINLDVAKTNNIKINSQLLSLAFEVLATKK